MSSLMEVSVPLNTCSKVFVQRDYSRGLGVQFETAFPSALDGKVSKQQWEHTITTLNSYYNAAEEVCCTTTQYEKALTKITDFLAEQNRNVYLPAGLFLTDPIERGLRVVKHFLNINFKITG
ncbi:unnamed protein product [Gongylonema pulchrum]|uniref:Ras modification protein ERF4 n=1 Tax=Gongylonema pulchrum TaxID=637853 RepID=A0A183DRI3_9BILA|nr:unnamed protein product [Gongylonema pulchrum]